MAEVLIYVRKFCERFILRLKPRYWGCVFKVQQIKFHLHAADRGWEAAPAAPISLWVSVCMDAYSLRDTPCGLPPRKVTVVRHQPCAHGCQIPVVDPKAAVSSLKFYILLEILSLSFFLLIQQQWKTHLELQMRINRNRAWRKREILVIRPGTFFFPDGFLLPIHAE